MKTTQISVTEAARNFAECVNRAHYQNVTFVLLKNGVPMARIVPAGEKTCLAGDLADALGQAPLTAEDAKAWRRDLKEGRKSLKPPTNKWR